MELYRLAERPYSGIVWPKGHTNGIVAFSQKALWKQSCITWSKGPIEMKLNHLVERPHENGIESYARKAQRKRNYIIWPKDPMKMKLYHLAKRFYGNEIVSFSQKALRK